MKHLGSPLLRVLGLACIASALQAGQVTLFQGPPGGVGSVQSYDEASGILIQAPTELAAVRLLPFELNGRSALDELLPNRARLFTDVAGATRVRLPSERGSLYHYVRTDAGGASAFGYLQVTRSGAVRSVHELAGIGPAGNDDPWNASIAVAPSGDSFVATTRPAAGGNVLEIRIAPAIQVIDRTAQLSARRFHASGLALTPSFGVAITGRGILRWDRAPAAQALGVSFAPESSPSYFSGALVTSANGTAAAITAGAGPTSLVAYTFGATGNAQRASDQPGELTGAGYLPEASDGPHLAVSDDARWCGWRARMQTGTVTTTEVFVGRTQAPAGEVPVQISADARFADTFDTVGVLNFFRPERLMFAVGELELTPAPSIENLDFYQADLVPGQLPVLTNLSLTSGDATVPFEHDPVITPSKLSLLPAGNGLLVGSDESGGTGKLYAVREAQSGAQVVLDHVKSLDQLELAGAYFWISIRRSDGERPQELYRLPADLSGPAVLIVSLPDGTDFLRPAVRHDGWVGYVTRATNLLEYVDRSYLPSGLTQEWTPQGDVYGPALTWTTNGGLAFSRGAPAAASTFFVWPQAGPTVQLQVPAVQGQILPGS